MNDKVLWFIIAFIVVIVTLGVLACIWKYVKSIFFDILFSIIIIGIAIVIYYPIKNAMYNNGFTSTDVVFQSDVLNEEDFFCFNRFVGCRQPLCRWWKG